MIKRHLLKTVLNRSKYIRLISGCFFVLIVTSDIRANESLARQWNEASLQAIRGDFARPTMHVSIYFMYQWLYATRGQFMIPLRVLTS